MSALLITLAVAISKAIAMYIYFNENPRHNYRAEDCVVRAISIVTGKSWNQVYAELCAEGFVIGDWGNSNRAWDTYLRENGFTRYICPNDCPYCYSISDFADEHKEGKYIVATGSHAVAVVDGNYIDSWDSGDQMPIYYYTY